MSTYEASELKSDEEKSLSEENTEKTLSKEDMDEFYREFGAHPETESVDPLVIDALADAKASADHWKEIVEKSKETARRMAQHISTIEPLFKSGAKIAIETDSDGETLKASIVSGGDERRDAVEALNSFLAECSEVRIPNKFYGDKVSYVRFPAVFAASGIYRASSEELFALLKETLASAEEVN